MKLTYVDSNVLMAAARGTSEVSDKALSFLDDPDRCYVSSDFTKLEIIPKATFHGFDDEREFYEAFFEEVERWIYSSKEVVEKAFDEACSCNLSGFDALHIACAKEADAEEFITAEKNTKPMFHVSDIEVTSIRD